MFRIKHDKGAADLMVLRQFSELLVEIQYVVEHKNSDKHKLKDIYQRNLSLGIKDESYLSAMHQSALGAAKCLL